MESRCCEAADGRWLQQLLWAERVSTASTVTVCIAARWDSLARLLGPRERLADELKKRG